MKDSVNFDAIINEFYIYLGEVLKLYEDSIPTLKTKLAAIACDDIDTLNKCIRTQQVFILKTKSFDGKILDFQSKLGITARNLTDTIGCLPVENRLMFYDLLGQFDIVMKEFIYHNDKCQALLQSKLYMIDKQLKKLQVKPDNMFYKNNAREAQPSGYVKSFETKI